MKGSSRPINSKEKPVNHTFRKKPNGQDGCYERKAGRLERSRTTTAVLLRRRRELHLLERAFGKPRMNFDPRFLPRCFTSSGFGSSMVSSVLSSTYLFRSIEEIRPRIKPQAPVQISAFEIKERLFRCPFFFHSGMGEGKK